jgi:DNA modification methylase
METRHRVAVGDARRLEGIDDNAVELVVTSPPYPMIELWDDVFADLDPAVGDALDAGDGAAAFDLMHDVLDDVWAEVERVLVDGGIACVNVGDATRSLDGSFRVYQNHARVVESFAALGFDPLPEILWRKPGNAAAKFMGSGMVPPNAYVTLEHEYVLILRNGHGSRTFEPNAERRYNAAYFWEERNRWFSDVWTDVGGTAQALDHDNLRDRAAAYPVEVPYRLVNMYSVYGDTVLDPFWGTGTTSVAALVAGRDSIGVERDPEFAEVFDDRVGTVPELSRRIARSRLADHRAFVEERREAGATVGYDADHYDFPVTTKQEVPIRLYAVDSVDATDEGYRATHGERRTTWSFHCPPRTFTPCWRASTSHSEFRGASPP